MEPRSEAEKALEELVVQLREAAGPNLLGVALYGGLAKGRYTPGVSDVNVLIVLAEAGLERLLPLSPAITRALRESRVVPFVVTPEDLRASALLFPGKILDMQASHRVLWGDVHLDGIAVAPEDLRLRARQEIKNAELRLRLRAVERSGDPDALWRGLMASLPKIAVTLETLLRLDGVAVPVDRPGLLRLAARELGIPADQMEPFTELRRVDRRPEDERVHRLYDAYLDLLSGISRRVEGEGAMTNPLDLRGPEFLAFYVPYVVCIFLLVWLARTLWHRAYEAPAGGRWGPGIYPAEIDIPAIALLRGGQEEVARTLVGRLVAEGFLVVDGRSMRRPQEALQDHFRLSPLEQKALSAGPGSVAEDARAALARVTKELEASLQPIRLELEAAGLTPGPSQRQGYRLLGLVALVIVVGLGVAKLLVAVSRGRGNVGFLILLLFFSFFISMRLMKSPQRTVAGDRYLEWLRTSHRGLAIMLADGRRQSFGELTLVAAIFGISYLPMLASLQTALVPPPRPRPSGESFWGGDSGCSSGGGDSGSSCGSSCGGGGGCGGGCGGCGG